MVTIRDIENEAAFIQSLIKLTNPTSRLRSATPWAAFGEHHIEAAGAKIAEFKYTEDRDVAAYFVNSHAGVISLLRNAAQSFEFVAQGADDAALKQYARDRAEYFNVFADLFCRLGKPVIDEAPEHGMDGKE